MKYCVQWDISCDTESNANNCLNGINTSISAITSGWENIHNKNSNNKSFSNVENKWKVTGIHRMADETEKTQLFIAIKGILHSPQIIGKIYWHKCSHDENDSACIIEELFEG